MGIALKTGGNIANVELVKIVTIEDSPKTIMFETTSNVKFVPATSAGTEVEQRVKNTIMGLLKTDDIVKGYDLTADDDRLIPEMLELVDGGTYTPGTGGTGGKYTGQVAGTPVKRKKFDMYVYSSDRDSDGEAIKYHEWKFPSCKGAPVEGGMEDNAFSKLSYKIASRPAKGVATMTMQEITALPEA